jgi:hypothetical protein
MRDDDAGYHLLLLGGVARVAHAVAPAPLAHPLGRLAAGHHGGALAVHRQLVRARGAAHALPLDHPRARRQERLHAPHGLWGRRRGVHRR